MSNTDDLSLKGRFHEEVRKLKELKGKARLQYIWDYYKPLMAIILAIALIITLIVQMVHNSKIDTILNIAVVNGVGFEDDSQEPLVSGFAEYAGITLDEWTQVSVDSSMSMTPGQMDTYTMSSMTKIMAMAGARSLDVMLMPEDVFEYYAKRGMFERMDVVLPEDVYKANEDKMCLSAVYTDEEQSENMDEMREGVDSEAEPQGEQLPFGVRLDNTGDLAGLCHYKPVVAAVVASAGNWDNSVKFVQYLLH